MLALALYRKLLARLRRTNVVVQRLDDSLRKQVYGLPSCGRNVTLVFRRYQMIANFVRRTARLTTELNILLERLSSKTLCDVGRDR
jgi:hypothetical protein